MQSSFQLPTLFLQNVQSTWTPTVFFKNVEFTQTAHCDFQCGRTEVQQKKRKIGWLPWNEKQRVKGKRFDKGEDERRT